MSASHDRRRGDRRHTDRRGIASPEESWFGALGVEGDTGFRDDLSSPPRRHAGDRREADTSPDTAAPTLAQQMSREARRAATSSDTALRRIWRTYTAARAALGVALLLLHGLALMLGTAALDSVPLALSLAYAAQALALWLWPRLHPGGGEPLTPPLSKPLWLASIGVDLTSFALLHLWAPVATLNYAALLVLPVLAAGVLTSRVAALGVAAAATLLLLLAALRLGAGGAGLAVPLLQGGLGGVGFAKSISSVMMSESRCACSAIKRAWPDSFASVNCIASNCDRPEITASGLFIS